MFKENEVVVLSADLTLNELIEEFIKTIQLENGFVSAFSFLTGVTPENNFAFYTLHIFATVMLESTEKEISLNAQYKSEAPFFLLRNSFTIDDQTEFFNKVKSTKAFTFIESNQIKPLNVCLIKTII